MARAAVLQHGWGAAFPAAGTLPHEGAGHVVFRGAPGDAGILSLSFPNILLVAFSLQIGQRACSLWGEVCRGSGRAGFGEGLPPAAVEMGLVHFSEGRENKQLFFCCFRSF